METFGVVIRWVHYLAASSLVGVFAFVVLVARPAAAVAGTDGVRLLAPLDRRLVTLARWLLALTLASGLVALARQATVATGRGFAESLTPATLGAVLLTTQYGIVWLVRHGLLLLLGAFLLLDRDSHDGADWLAVRLEGLLLGGLTLAVFAAAGHAASAQWLPTTAMVIDGVHLLATGLWFGSLLPLAALLRWSATLPTPAALPVTAEAARRFSALGVASVAALVLTGLYNTWEQVGSVATLFGTEYGRWLCLKLTLLVPLLGIAALNLLVLRPRLARAARTGAAGAGLANRLRRHVIAEAALGAAILAVVAILGVTTPGRHAQPEWPFAFRFSWQATKFLAGVQTRVAIGSQLALLGLIAALLAAIVRRRGWRWVVVAGAGGVGLGLAVALPPLAVDAYPTTYVRPAVPYAAESIADGLALYRAHCAVCHGVSGYGDGPAAAGLSPRPANLTGLHTLHHTAGDLFWWLVHGIPRSAMPGFADRLSVEQRWDVINFLRALAAAEQARELGSQVVPELGFAAPDFTFTTGVGEARSLKDYRGERAVLLVLFTLPESAPRLVQLSEVYPSLRFLGAEIVGIPLRRPREVYRALGSAPVFFPIAVDGAEEAATALGLFRRDTSPEGGRPDPPLPRHLELLVDRQGYLRARWLPGGEAGWRDPAAVVAEVERLTKEASRAAPPAEHVH
ncbi:MAG TPA: CopD family protein [Methylomirabilota bacterium]|jgi:putative copper resistance protein D|nr:CopD family protein [Methylomirabilota bacterium]